MIRIGASKEKIRSALCPFGLKLVGERECVCGKNVLSRLIPKSTRLVLAAVQDIPCESFATKEIVLQRRYRLILCRIIQCGLYQRPAIADPVRVAGINQLVGPSGEPSLWSVLPSRKPREKERNIHVSAARQQLTPPTRAD